jgi:hypothetical protein
MVGDQVIEDSGAVLALNLDCFEGGKEKFPYE